VQSASDLEEAVEDVPLHERFPSPLDSPTRIHSHGPMMAIPSPVYPHRTSRDALALSEAGACLVLRVEVSDGPPRPEHHSCQAYGALDGMKFAFSGLHLRTLDEHIHEG
jgi:hypothetical protein